MENINRVQYNRLTFIHLYLVATKLNREFATAENRTKFLRFLKNT